MHNIPDDYKNVKIVHIIATQNHSHSCKKRLWQINNIKIIKPKSLILQRNDSNVNKYKTLTFIKYASISN